MEITEILWFWAKKKTSEILLQCYGFAASLMGGKTWGWEIANLSHVNLYVLSIRKKDPSWVYVATVCKDSPHVLSPTQPLKSLYLSHSPSSSSWPLPLHHSLPPLQHHLSLFLTISCSTLSGLSISPLLFSSVIFSPYLSIHLALLYHFCNPLPLLFLLPSPHTVVPSVNIFILLIPYTLSLLFPSSFLPESSH